jgi:hypothetical protein
MATRIPTPAYQDTGVLYGDKKLYARIGKIAESDAGKMLVEEFEIPIRSGKAWVVKKGKCYVLRMLIFGTRNGRDKGCLGMKDIK